MPKAIALTGYAGDEDRDRALAAFQSLKGIRKPNLIYLLTADKRWTLGEGFLGYLEGGETVTEIEPMLTTVIREKLKC